MVAIRSEDRAKWQQPAWIGAGVMAATAILAVGNPNTTHVPLCPLKAITGLDCPFCGSLRAVHSLAHFHPGEAANHNLLFTMATPVLVASWAVWLARSIGRRHQLRPVRALPHSGVVAFWVVAAVFMVARNTTAFAWLGSGA